MVIKLDSEPWSMSTTKLQHQKGNKADKKRSGCNLARSRRRADTWVGSWILPQVWNSRPPRPPGVFLVLKSAESVAYSCPCSSVLKTTSVLLIFTKTSVPRRPRCRARLYQQNTWSCCVSWLSKTPSKYFASLSLSKSVKTSLCFLCFAWPLTLLCFRTASRTMLLSRNSLSTRKLKGRLAAVTFRCMPARADK